MKKLSSRFWPYLALVLPIASSLLMAHGATPSILIFIDDDLSQFDIEPYGATDARTPHFQKLADSGLTFLNAFVASPACAPSRAALLTGLMPARNGAKANHTYKRPEIPPVLDGLKQLGYEVAAFGKVAHGARDIESHGFDHWDRNLDKETIESWLSQRDGEKPLLLFVGSRQPHVPWPESEGYDPATLRVPDNHIDTQQTRAFRARYYTDVTTSDAEFAYATELADRYLGKDRITIFTSDHGSQWPFAKWNLYDAGIKVPFIASWPGRIPAKKRTGAMISWIDIVPTLIDIAGGENDGTLDGRSFKTALLEGVPTHRERIYTLHDNDGRANVYPIRSVRDTRYKYIRNLHPKWMHSTHSYRFRKDDAGAYWWSWDEKAKTDSQAAAIVQRYHFRPYEELYDLEADPNEANNLAAVVAYRDTVLRLRGELDAWMEQQGDDTSIAVEPWLLGDEGFLDPATQASDWR